MFTHFKKTTILGIATLGIGLVSFTNYQPFEKKDKLYLSDDDALSAVYEKLGKIKINAINTSIAGVSAEKGKEIVLQGYTTKPDGKGKTKMQSPYFKCTACHNVEKEFEDLSDISAQKRLEYAEKNNLPFLQGSSFFGIVNRTTFYNDDYQKKYGHVPIIKASNNDIRQAIQLCATQCSQGRALSDWEIESVLAYFWTLELKIKDLKLSQDNKTLIEAALNNPTDRPQAINLLENSFLDKSPAHFADSKDYAPLDDAKRKDIARFKNGKAIYQRSCLHCHKGRRYAFFSLDENKFSFTDLLGKSKANSKSSLSKITRYGTPPLNGKRAYMPQYPLEKLSEEQLEDLQIYIENMAVGIDLSK